MQTREELEKFWEQPDPWGFRSHPDDADRRARLVAAIALTDREYSFAIDVGCGDGFLTEVLPASCVVGIDLARNAIKQAEARTHRPGVTFSHTVHDMFDISHLAPADLIVCSGVLYEQYVGASANLVGMLLASALKPGGDLVVAGISDWLCVTPPLALLHREHYPYRGYGHRLEVWRKLS